MQQRSSIKYTCAAIAWTIMVSYALMMPAREIQSPDGFSFPGQDKVVHMLLFAVLTFLLAKALRERSINWNKVKLFFALSLFGLITELVQFKIPDRSADILDLCADVIGVIVGLILIRII